MPTQAYVSAIAAAIWQRPMCQILADFALLERLMVTGSLYALQKDRLPPNVMEWPHDALGVRSVHGGRLNQEEVRVVNNVQSQLDLHAPSIHPISPHSMSDCSKSGQEVRVLGHSLVDPDGDDAFSNADSSSGSDWCTPFFCLLSLAA